MDPEHGVQRPVGEAADGGDDLRPGHETAEAVVAEAHEAFPVHLVADRSRLINTRSASRISRRLAALLQWATSTRGGQLLSYLRSMDAPRPEIWD